MKNTDITNMTVEALDIEELERRLELAAQSADCSCCGDNSGGCTSNSVKTVTAATTKPPGC